MKTIFTFPIFLLTSFAGFAQGFWLTTPDFPGGPKTAFIGIQDSILLTATSSGIWRSENEGLSWTKKLNSTYIFSLCASSNGTIIAGGIGKLFVSYNQGTTWDSVSVSTSYPVTKIVENNSHEYFIVASGFTNEEGFVGDGVFYNNGDLRIWEKRNTGLPANLLSAEQLAIDRNGRIYITLPDENTTGNGGLYYSNNKGLSWQQSPLYVSNLGTIKVLNSASISITPQDSIVVSVNGTAVNISTRLNLIKHVNDIAKNTSWRPWGIRKAGNWWEDLNLNTIHFAKNGEWYSSVSSSTSTGGSFYSTDKGLTWLRRTTGMGISRTDRYESNFHFESSDGKVFMVQLLDERVYYTAQSLLNPITLSGNIKDDQGKPLMGVTVTVKNIRIGTNSEGGFYVALPVGWSGTIVPQLGRHIFEPESVSISNARVSASNINFIGKYIGTYFISGFVRDISGQPIGQIPIEGFPQNLSTNEFGYYITEVPAQWNGTVTPVFSGYQFNPNAISISQVNSDRSDQNFIIRKMGSVYVTGKIKDENGEPFIDATLNGFPETTRIDATGNFYGEVPVGWSGTIIPVSEGYQFTPDKIQVTNLRSDLIDQAFIASQVPVVTKYVLSGFVTDFSGVSLNNIAIMGFPNEVKTALDGSYHVELPDGWSGAIMPVSDKYAFSPATISINNLSASLANQNFTGAIVTAVVDENLSNSVYPNPTRDGLIYLRAKLEMHVRIWNSTGQVIWQGDSKDLSLNEFHLPQSGIYFVSVTDKANKMQTIKILFQ
jgi:hypothetical protein